MTTFWRLLGTSVTVDYGHCDVPTWKKACEYALLERMALDRAWEVRHMPGMTYSAFVQIPHGPHGEVYAGASDDVMAQPRYAACFRELTELTRGLVAMRSYRVRPHPGGESVRSLLTDRPGAYAKVDASAKRVMAGVHNDVARLWIARVQASRRQFPEQEAVVRSMSERAERRERRARAEGRA